MLTGSVRPPPTTASRLTIQIRLSQHPALTLSTLVSCRCEKYRTHDPSIFQVKKMPAILFLFLPKPTLRTAGCSGRQRNGIEPLANRRCPQLQSSSDPLSGHALHTRARAARLNSPATCRDFTSVVVCGLRVRRFVASMAGHGETRGRRDTGGGGEGERDAEDAG